MTTLETVEPEQLIDIEAEPQVKESWSSPGRPADRRVGRRRSLLILAGLALVAGLAGWIAKANADADARHGQELRVQQQASFEDITGIRVVRVALSAGGGIVDLRYQVLDPDKALAIHDDEAPPRLIDEKTAEVVAIPFHDHATRELHTAVTYREMFMNGGGALDRGDRVTIEVGEAVIQHIEVE